MGNINPNIKPGGLAQLDLVDALAMAFQALYALCVKLDDDAGVPSADYEANCWTAMINTIIEDSRGNRTGQAIDETSTIGPTRIITPTGIDDAAIAGAMYQWVNAWETLCEQLDADSLTLTNYEAYAFTATILQLFENCKGYTVGNGYAFRFRPGGMLPEDQLIEALYSFFKSIYELCAGDGATYGLDQDGTVTDADYESEIYDGYLTLLIEDGQGNTIGASR